MSWRRLRHGFDRDVRLRSKFDYFMSDDGFDCVNKRGRAIFEESGAMGLEFVPIPDGQHFVVVPTQRVEVKREQLEVRETQVMDLDAIARNPSLIATARKSVRVEVDSCGMEFRGCCGACGRCFETLYWPKLNSMILPKDASLVVSPDVLSEKSWHSVVWLLASEAIVKSLQKAGLRGLEPVEAS